MTRVSLLSSPFLLGFERLEGMLERAARSADDGYPPYNIEQTSETSWRIVLAVAGFRPENLSVTAYQTQDRVIVLITGSNRSAGYTTCLTEVDTSCEIPTLTMRNTAPTRSSAHCMTGFNLNAAVRSRETLCTIRLLVAGQTVEVPVTQVPSLS